MEVQQSSLYADYLRSLGWQTVKFDDSYIFIKRFPLLGTLAKAQRVTKLPNPSKFFAFLHEYRVRRLAIEPDSIISEKKFFEWCQEFSKYCRLNSSPFLPTKTILINLAPTEEEIFKHFSEAKRRAVRRAQKNHIVVRQSRDINTLIRTKNTSTGFLGFITTYGITKLWRAFSPKRCTILLAYSAKSNSLPLGCVLLLFWDKIAYYWIAGATKEGKKLFVPTLLVWESLRIAKKHGALQFDFVGAWDERLPKKNLEWKGFTKFKEGFGGSAKYYPIVQ